MEEKIKLSKQQIESLRNFFVNYFNADFDAWKHFLSDYEFAKKFTKDAIEILLKENEISDLKFITISILKTDDVLIPVCVLEDLIKD